MTHNSTTQGNLPSNLTILLGAPSHDRLTNYTSNLLALLPKLGAPTILIKFQSPLTYDQMLSQQSINPNTTDIALIFCGHGEETSLEGPGAYPGASNYRKTRSTFYDESHHDQGPKFLLAFCCSAATGLGESFKQRTKGCTFVGFKTKIPIVTKEGVYAECWRKIIYGSASMMLQAKNRRELKKTILDLYRKAYEYFDSPQGSKHEHELWMRMSLIRQKEVIRFIKT
jgi:hypothetical protein